MSLSKEAINMIEEEFSEEVEALEEVDTYELYDNHLNELNDTKIGESQYATLLHDNDENAYDEGYADWIETLNENNSYFVQDEKFYENEDVIELLEEFIENIRDLFNNIK